MVTRPLASADPRAPHRIYAIGDVHGCAEQLAGLHAAIRADLEASPAQATLVYLGDYIDRGPDSAGVIEALLRGPAVAGAAMVALMGNHERMLLDALAAPANAATWLANGGAASLASWGIDRHARPELWAQRLPPDHRRFIAGLQLSHRAGRFLFVHAGVDPRRPLDSQREEDMLWIRGPFLSWRGDLPGSPGTVVVHGHTPVAAPEVLPNRINVDTGAVFGRALTCAVLNPAAARGARDVRFLQAGPRA